MNMTSFFPCGHPATATMRIPARFFKAVVLEELIKQACTVATSVFRPWHSLRSFTPVGGIEEREKNQDFNIVKDT